MPDYKNGKIYTIRCHDDPSLIYVGSTTKLLCQRFAKHKYHSKEERCKSMLLYTTIKEQFDNDWSKFYIELYEEFPCENKEQLNKREGEVQREIATLNKNVAGRCIVESNRIYRENNTDAIKERKKQFYLLNSNTIKQKRRQYRQEHQDEINQKQKENYQANSDVIKQRQKKSFICNCGVSYTYGHKSRHMKSKKHQDYLKIFL